ncbi:MAG: hypothetical protein KY445_11955 [Armatimonadetes bacterium]|nr:hypothetical protein [Armatimonadota bacterium]
MSKPISRPLHGVLDYGYAAAIAASPELFNFQDQPSATILCRAMGALTFVTSLCTRYELGAIRVLPFKMHLAADALTGIMSLGAPWLLGFASHERARNTFVGFGVLALVVSSLTQPAEME